MKRVDIHRCYEDTYTPVRCTCGNIPVVTKGPSGTTVLIECQNYACDNPINGVLGVNRTAAVTIWNNNIKTYFITSLMEP